MINLDTITSTPKITPTTTNLSLSDRWDHFLARVGFKRGQHRVEPGLYSIGKPSPASPVFVTANYSLSFDALRSNLENLDAYILVLDTNGVNVWCAAGKKTFGTEELVIKIASTRLNQMVDRKVIILPQLGAPGVSAHEVKQRTGFKVEYGPVRAADLPEYLKTHVATPEMRQVKFGLKERLVLTPIEIIHFLPLFLLVSLIFYFLLGGWIPALAVLSTFISSVILFPIFLPWLPSHNFSFKGFFLGVITAIPFAILIFLKNTDRIWYQQVGQALGYLLVIPPVIAFIALNFTGSSAITSKTGVRREMYAYIPAMAWTFVPGFLLSIIVPFIH